MVNQLIRASDAETLTDEEFFVAQEAIGKFRKRKAAETETHEIAPGDVASARSAGSAHGDPIVEF